MIDAMFPLGDEHRMIRDTARDFATKTIAPIAAAFDESGEFPHDTIKKMGMKFGVRVEPILSYDNQKFAALVTDYNRAARKQKRDEIALGRGVAEADSGRGAVDRVVVDVSELERQVVIL